MDNQPWVMITNTAATSTELLELELTAPVDGFMYIYVANETNDDINVYFDNLTITHTGLQVVENTDYYPYGMVMRKELPSQSQGIYSRYRYGYQGQFAEKDEETGWNHFELRQYGSRIGRWTATDPYRQYASPYMSMGNNPINRVDPDGGEDIVRYNSNTGKTTIVETSGPDRLFIDGKFSGIMGADGSWRDMGFDVNQYIMFEAVINSPIGDKAQFNFNQKIRNSRKDFIRYNALLTAEGIDFFGKITSYTGYGLAFIPGAQPVAGVLISVGSSLSTVSSFARASLNLADEKYGQAILNGANAVIPSRASKWISSKVIPSQGANILNGGINIKSQAIDYLINDYHK